MALQAFRQDLIDLNYPNIDQLNDDQVADILSSEYRVFFISWVFRQIDIQLTETKAELEEELIDLVYASGFCTTSQKTKFVKGDMSLDLDVQLSIITNMLKYLKTIKAAETTPINAETSKPIPLEKLWELLNMDLNLFPALGPIKQLSKSQREAEMRTYNDLEGSLESLRATRDSLRREVNLLESKDRIVDPPEPNFEAMKKLFLDFQGVKTKLEKCTAETSKGATFSSDFERVSKDCSEKITKLSQYFKDLAKVQEYSEHNLNPEKSINENRKTVQRLADMSSLIECENKNDKINESNKINRII